MLLNMINFVSQLQQAHLVSGWIGIHRQHALAQEAGIGVRQLNLSHLTLQISLKALTVLVGVAVGMGICAFEKVESHIVGRIESVSTPYVMVDMFGNSLIEVGLGHIVGQLLEPLVDARSAMIMNVSLESHNAGLHADDIVHRSLLPSLNVATQLELLGLEEVAGVKLVADGKRNDVQRQQTLLH